MITPTVQDAERLKYSDFVGVRFGFFPTTYTLVKEKQKKPPNNQKTKNHQPKPLLHHLHPKKKKKKKIMPNGTGKGVCCYMCTHDTNDNVI